MGITARTVVQIVLTLSLLVSFTTSAAAAMCLQMSHDSSQAGMRMSADVTDLPDRETPGPTSGAGAGDTLENLRSVHPCCEQQVSTPQGVMPPQGAVLSEQEVGSALDITSFPAHAGSLPPWVSHAWQERRDHLAPSLTALSISRT